EENTSTTNLKEKRTETLNGKSGQYLKNELYDFLAVPKLEKWDYWQDLSLLKLVLRNLQDNTFNNPFLSKENNLLTKYLLGKYFHSVFKWVKHDEYVKYFNVGNITFEESNDKNGDRVISITKLLVSFFVDQNINSLIKQRNKEIIRVYLSKQVELETFWALNALIDTKNFNKNDFENYLFLCSKYTKLPPDIIESILIDKIIAGDGYSLVKNWYSLVGPFHDYNYSVSDIFQLNDLYLKTIYDFDDVKWVLNTIEENISILTLFVNFEIRFIIR
ncbi:hypothetical protein MHK_010024, partial [Candidatus Magnetomorum sp. HK-1]